MALRFEPIRPEFGARVSGVKITLGISDSEFSNIEQSCLIEAGTGTQVLRSRFFNCGKTTTTSDRHGLLLKGPNVVVRDNEVYDTAGACIYVNFEGAVLEGNRLHACGTSGIEWAEVSTQPGAMMRTGGSWLSIVRICTGEV